MLDAINIDTNERLGRYELLEEIGRGAMGVVYLARDPLIGRHVALKVFRVGFSASDDELRNLYARFIREAQSAGILSHPHIVTVHDVAQADGESPAFIAMEYVEGRTLKQILDVPEPISRRRAIDLLSQVASALDYAHSMGVVHRDVKPGNVLVAADDLVKITDFGIAVVNASNITNYGQLLGTPNYMAPESIEERQIDHRADLFSLGVVLYELLTRHKPFGGSSLTKVTRSIVQEPFTPAEEYGVDLPAGLRDCVTRALEKDPDKRFQTAAQFARALDMARQELDSAEAAASAPSQEGPHASSATDPALDVSTAEDTQASDPIPVVDTKSIEVGPVPPAGPVAAIRTAATPVASPKADRGVPALSASRPTRRWLSPWLLATGIVLGIALGYVLSRSPVVAPSEPSVMQPPPTVDVLAPLRERVRDLTALAEARQTVGDVEGVYLALAEAARIDPSSRGLAEQVREAERRLLAARTDRQAQIDEHLSAARRSLDAGRYRDASQYAYMALDIDPLSVEAEDIVLTAQAEEDRSVARSQEAVPEPTPIQVDERPSPVIAEPEPDVEAEPVEEPEPVVPVATVSTLTIELEAALSPGVITLYESGSQIFRERFRFTREGKGFIDNLRAKAKASGGILSRELDYEPGDVDLRLYVSLPGSATQVLPLSGSLVAGEAHVLSITIDEDGQATADLR